MYFFFHLYMHPILGDILPDVKVSGVIKCGEFDTPLETPFHVIRVWVSMSVLNPVLCPIIQLFALKTEQCGFIMQNTVKLLRTDQYNSDSEVDPSKIRLILKIRVYTVCHSNCNFWAH